MNVSDKDIQEKDQEKLLKKRTLLFQQLKAKKTRTQPVAQEIPQQKRDTNVFPLSFGQERLWFLEQLQPGTATYHIPIALRLCGELHVQALTKSLQMVVQRHEVLRTTFTVVDDQAVQIIMPASQVPVQVVDLSNLDVSVQKICVTQYVQDAAQELFNLQKGPVLHVTLLRLTCDTHVLLVTLHHMVADGWSLGVLIREMMALYTGYNNAQPADMPSLPIQYADYAVWQRQQLQGPSTTEHLDYWRTQLRDLQPLQLPTDYRRPPVQSYRGATASFTLDDTLKSQLNVLSQQTGTTLFMALFAVWQLLLWRYSGQTDIATGTPIAGRTHVALEPLIGFFVNTLVLRTQLTQRATVQDLLEHVRMVTLEAYAHQSIPFETIVEILHPVRDVSRPPIIQTMCALQNMPFTPTTTLSQIQIEQLHSESTTAKFDLSLVLTEVTSGITGVLEYGTDLFDETTITRLVGHFQSLLAGIVTHPGRAIGSLSLLTTDEQQQILVDWNTTYQPSTPGWTHHRVAYQALSTPTALALQDDEQSLSYAELEACANQLAQYLQSVGVGPEVPVGICMNPSCHLVVSALAILKAGGAYVPLEPTYPDERLHFMLHDAQITILLTQTSLQSRFAGYEGHIVTLDQGQQVISSAQAAFVTPSLTGENLAYIIYTSGSTGFPKGVQITHRGLSNLVDWHQRAFAVTAADRATQVAGIAFDAAVWELWPYLTCGASVAIAGEAVRRDPVFMRDWLIDQAVTLCFIPTPLAEAILTLPWPQHTVLRMLLTGGDYLHQPPPLDVPFTLVNNYGPTENTVVATSSPIPPVPVEQVPTIGQPIDNSTVYMLDQYVHPVPIRIPGELYIGGRSLARGYLAQPGRTAETFVPHPFSAEPGARLYRTGDLARYRPDGSIDFLGRIDQQVKIRGFRIELGEIETTLQRHSQVQEAVVLAREDTPQDRRLAAYIVASSDRQLDSQMLREYLSDQLPPYMVPSAFVILDTLPLTPNGKVDRKALPAPEYMGTTRDFVAPRDTYERQLARIWEDILRVAPIDVTANFFDLGGDSILSLQIMTRAAQMDMHFSLNDLFQHPTVGELATIVRQEPLTPISQALVTGSVPLTPIQHWFFDQPWPNPHHFNQSVLLQTVRPLDPELLRQVVYHLLIHHDALRMRFAYRVEGWYQYCAAPDDSLPFSIIDLSHIPADAQAHAIESTANEVQQSLHITNGPLCHIALITLGDDQPARLLFCVHHLVIDGVSWRILLEDFQIAYQQLETGKNLQLPLKTTAFQDWGHQLTQYAQSETLQREIAYWQAQPWQDVQPIPGDMIAGENIIASACQYTISVSPEDTATILRDVLVTYDVQINEVLLTAFVQAWMAWSGQDTLLLDLEGHGREDLFDAVDLSRTVGWFTTVYPVILQIRADLDPLDALQMIQQQIRAIPQRGIGYGILRYLADSGTIRDSLKTLPLSRVSFNYLGQFDQTFSSAAVFSPAPESSGSDQDARTPRQHLLGMSGSVVGGQLHLTWTYSDEIHMQSTIEHLAHYFTTALQRILDDCHKRQGDTVVVVDEAEHSTVHVGIEWLLGSTSSPVSHSVAWSPIVPIQKTGTQPPLFLVHPSGGNTFCYTKLAHYLDSDQPVYGIQAKGLIQGQDPYESIEDMATYYVDELRRVQPNGPYNLGGWSGGAIIAFEMAQQLHAHGQVVKTLVLLDQGTNTSYQAFDYKNSVSLLYGLVDRLGLTSFAFPNDQSIDEIITTILQQAQQERKLPSGLNADTIQRFIRVYQTNHTAAGYYRAQPYAGRISLFLTEQSRMTLSEEIAHLDEGPLPDAGWKSIAQDGVDIYLVPGTHMNMLEDPHVQQLATHLKLCLTRTLMSHNEELQ